MLYQNLIDQFTSMSKEIIGNKLTGIYLHGSMAMNCFNPEKSDIDLIIVIEENITDVQKMEFMKQVVKMNEQAPAKGLEISIVRREYCKPFVYPTPFELHFSPIHEQWFQDNPENYVEHMKGEDRDLAAHFTIINRYGIVLYGEPIENVFGEVSKRDYIESIWSDVEGAREDIADEPMYITLNLCRVLAYLKEDLCLSKKQGGEWGIAHMPERYHPLIINALECYKTNQVMQADKELAGQFADETLTIIGFEREQIE
ncbi:aminoglycoside adenylyltransferase domain-containing protein [Anaeromicropila herbilytica]|uniref:Adenylyltransferase n=1 Tax=Anaeromicropila herbilytica TaxID=2785025 RepID=A0A7R7ICV3_9FIRM|nr:aminoglycoside adenylyltransferase domain-containing protein [Anaeromicropila herbilytica]BCN30922.1 adenylyltransferase [Anaeromicropila herbilytica]